MTRVLDHRPRAGTILAFIALAIASIGAASSLTAKDGTHGASTAARPLPGAGGSDAANLLRETQDLSR